ncbi:33K [Bat mastadenovirus WIV13]|uniref:33K n=1 Tax=Bat mastadenovirus WIV13 TaxID=1788435 RepID=A0A1B0UHZ6_9ADEN|nr:33K [Bat mastadenovirus WIV13]AMB43035.1 33K [Bat mastadenovirus WIV13]
MPCKTGKNLTNYQTIQQLSETMETPESDPETSQASLEEGEIPESPPIPAPPAVSKKKSRWDIKHTVPSEAKKATPKAANLSSTAAADKLRDSIFPTLYAIFQQSRGQEKGLKIKNRSLRSLTRSCFYHKNEAQLLRTRRDAELLLRKYCAANKTAYK